MFKAKDYRPVSGPEVSRKYSLRVGRDRESRAAREADSPGKNRIFIRSTEGRTCSQKSTNKNLFLKQFNFLAQSVDNDKTIEDIFPTWSIFLAFLSH